MLENIGLMAMVVAVLMVIASLVVSLTAGLMVGLSGMIIALAIGCVGGFLTMMED